MVAVCACPGEVFAHQNHFNWESEWPLTGNEVSFILGKNDRRMEGRKLYIAVDMRLCFVYVSCFVCSAFEMHQFCFSFWNQMLRHMFCMQDVKVENTTSTLTLWQQQQQNDAASSGNASSGAVPA